MKKQLSIKHRNNLETKSLLMGGVMVFNLSRKQEGDVMESSVAYERTPVPVLENVEIWNNLRELPDLGVLKKKIICLEYTSEKSKAELLNWVDMTIDYAINEGILFISIVVFADYEKLSSEDVADLVGEFNELGAMFSDFPENSFSFDEAVKNFDSEVAEAIANFENYDSARMHLLERRKAEVEQCF